ncbi:MAG: MFS transporter [Gemmataceae bacterium]
MGEVPDDARLRRWQGATVATLFAGYAGYYVCRSNLSVVTPLLLAEYGPALTERHIGDVVSAGVLAYAVGKLLTGAAADVLGGRRLFLAGLFGSVACTLLFVLAGRAAGAAVLLPFTAVWVANRFVQSMGWGGLVQITGRWFPADRLASVMGVLSLSYLLGDAAARLALGGVVKLRYGWEAVFLVSAAVLGLIGVACVVALRQRPADLGLPEPPPPPGNVYGADAGDARVSLWQLVGPLVRSGPFWLVCLMSGGLTLIRETFNFWNPTYLTRVARLDPGTAGMTSLLFPLVGAGAAVLAGWLADRAGGRVGRVAVPSLVGLTAALAALAVVPVGELPDGVRPAVALGLISLVAFFLIAPYTFCAGALALKIGGQRGGSTAAGLIDTAGYVGAILSGSGVGRLAAVSGWGTAFAALAGVAAVTLAVAAVFAVREGRDVTSPTR